MAKGEAPKVGQIVRHHFLWSEEKAAGRAEGAKARPCIIIAVESRSSNDAPRVTVLPVTSQAPRSDAAAVAVPDGLKARIELDPGRPAWVVIDQANVFTWPGFDLVPSSNGNFIRGMVTSGFFEQIAATVIAVHARGHLRRTDRDDG
ncbi:MAG TPA: type II toxin-antitoxin system PemK/MazF family toxin [Rhizomicrobium sp.]|nr:type II toxin-antitoxin system PemK/MazF family toxin [Rhizomicrobium sp.]